MKHFSFLISVNSPAFFMALFTSKFQQFQDQNDAREGKSRVDRKLRSNYSTSLFSMDRRSIQHTRDLHIGNVMKHILINIDKTPVVVNHSLKLRFKQSDQFFYRGIQRNLLAVITGRPSLIHESSRLRCSPEEDFKSQKRSFFLNAL